MMVILVASVASFLVPLSADEQACHGGHKG